MHHPLAKIFYNVTVTSTHRTRVRYSHSITMEVKKHNSTNDIIKLVWGKKKYYSFQICFPCFFFLYFRFCFVLSFAAIWSIPCFCVPTYFDILFLSCVIHAWNTKFGVSCIRFSIVMYEQVITPTHLFSMHSLSYHFSYYFVFYIHMG